MNVETILRNKGNWVATIRPDATIAEAVDMLHKERIGAIVVSEDGAGVDGILSERDIVKAVSAGGAAALEEKITARMTREVITCGPQDTMAELMGRMTAGRFRHLPVVENGRLVGIISIGDVVKHRLAEMERESSALRDYIMTA